MFFSFKTGLCNPDRACIFWANAHMFKIRLIPDPRYFQIIFQLLFLSYGIFFLEWIADWVHYAMSIGGCLLFNYSAESLRQKRFMSLYGKGGWKSWGLSVLISALSLCLLLKSNHWYTSLLAAFLTVFSKYIFRIGKKHVFNPSAFGIISTMMITGDAWLSPGQWGTGVLLFFLIIILGTIVVTRVQKLDTSLAFLLTYASLLYWRQVYQLGWPLDYFIHSVSSGTLLLFSFFMISDPKTSPDHAIARIVWSVGVAATAFFFAAFEWKYNTPIWVLVAAAPLVPLLDKIFKAKSFAWPSAMNHLHILSKLKKNNHEIS